MNRYLLISLFLLVLFVVPSAAMHFSGSGTTLEVIINSGGSADLDPSGTDTFQDSKGYPILSPFDSEKTIINMGLGAILGAVTPEEKSGTARLYISRSVNDIKITWEASKYPKPTIFALADNTTNDGKGIYTNQYVIPPNSVPEWKTILKNGALMSGVNNGDLLERFGTFIYASDGELINKDQVGSVSTRKEIYYKAIINGIEPGSTPGYDYYVQSAEAVGKFDVYIDKNLSSIPVSLPFELASAATVDDLIGPQLTAGVYSAADKIFTWDLSGSLKEAWLSSSGWNGSLTVFEPGKGYWIVPSQTKTITVVGRIINQPITILLSGPPNTANFGGLPYPKSLTPDQAGLTSILTPGNYAGSDKIQSWNSSGTLIEAWLDPTGWKGTLTTMSPGKGYWITNKQTTTTGSPDNWRFQP